MPQMAPMSWMSLYLSFCFLFILLYIYNYFLFIYKPTKILIKKSRNQVNWKW
uniref:ATP synthase complex subunit 8 n=1 Tax=Euscepes postfasciatus TaxID=650466 RepID=A0A8J9S1B6_9CUCU|nr:ATP synthase F0 subunit 8 [Euscepes postfasciatus]BCT02350.1 ATP synthase F0 subunit 8 [Euscepes postfasciatus]BCT02353.1 ATP synthase F0 subunit 8 [Euscepes postfasciatus]BCT02356.1 ATP synthase F0 subunit 8 [Euscepes postfasciatus]BCT02359.1 ATP synthase F0 subunit 8 [Euscepes postfasciatus]